MSFIRTAFLVPERSSIFLNYAYRTSTPLGEQEARRSWRFGESWRSGNGKYSRRVKRFRVFRGGTRSSTEKDYTTGLKAIPCVGTSAKLEHSEVSTTEVTKDEIPRPSPIEEKAKLVGVAYYDLGNQYFQGPEDGAYISVYILDPIVTIERHRDKYHISTAFNMETTILRYNDRDWYCAKS